jgi:hypothetical protein
MLRLVKIKHMYISVNKWVNTTYVTVTHVGLVVYVE